MRRHAVLVAAVACLTVVGPAVAAPTPPPPDAAALDVHQLQRLRDQLEAAAGDLSALDAAIDAATAELDEIASRVVQAEADLADTRTDLVEAEREHADAVRRADRATETLARATADLDRASHRADVQDAAMAGRVRSMWKYGASDPKDLLLEGLARSESLHDATMTLQAVQDLVESDRELVDQTEDLTRAEARVRATVVQVRVRARRAEARAAAERRRVTQLVAEQERLVASVDADRAAQRAVLEALAADRGATARLVEQLEARVARLSAQLARALVAADPTARFDGPSPAWAAGLPPRGRALAPAIVGAARIAGVDARLFAALVWSESAFHDGALSHAGAQGLAQLMPTTAVGLGVDARDPVQNLIGGARYLRSQLEQFGTADLALAAYNAGPGRVQAAGNRIPDITETQVYVLRVLERYEQLVALG